MLLKRISYMDIDKSKLSPELSGIPLVIDNTEGGAVDSLESFVQYLVDIGLIKMSKGWYNFDTILEMFSKSTPYINILLEFLKSYRYDDLIGTVSDNPQLYTLLNYLYCLYYSGIYKLQREVMRDRIRELRIRLLEYYQSPYDIAGSRGVDDLTEELGISQDDLLSTLESLDWSGDLYSLVSKEYVDSYCNESLVVGRDEAQNLVDFIKD